MALLQLGSVVTDIRNSIGGVTYSRNRGGSYSRARVAPLNPRSAAQTSVRQNFALNSKLWSGTLTAAQRVAWTIFAQNNPVTNVFGASKILSGNAMLMKLNQVLKQIGAAPITDPPTDLSVPALAAVLAYDGSGSPGALLVTTAAQSVTAGVKYYIFATRPLPPGRTPQTSDYRYIKTTAAVAAAVSIDITDAYEAMFGEPTAGTLTGVLVATVNTASGALTVGTQVSGLNNP